MIIDPSDGRVIRDFVIDEQAWLGDDDQASRASGDVLNGIAWDASRRKLFITGKNWPKLFEVSFAN